MASATAPSDEDDHMNHASSARRDVLAFLALFPATLRIGHAAEAPPRSYAVLSLVGDQLTIVTRRRTTGTPLDPNDHQVMAVDNGSLDAAIAGAVESAITAASPSSQWLNFSIRDPRLFALQEQLLSAGDASDALREALRGLLVKAGATHLIIVTKWRGEATFRLINDSVGGGKIMGLGFYVDDITRTKLLSTGERTLGFIAPFAYMKVSLLDAATLKVSASKVAATSSFWTPAETKDAASAWEIMTAKEKSQALERVIRQAVSKAMGELLAE
jgi:hypothetical protein